jgi:bacterioferritin-associated ferredoxin
MSTELKQLTTWTPVMADAGSCFRHAGTIFGTLGYSKPVANPEQDL